MQCYVISFDVTWFQMKKDLEFNETSWTYRSFENQQDFFLFFHLKQAS